MSGPRERRKLQPRGIEALMNRMKTEQKRWEGLGGQGPFPIYNEPTPRRNMHSNPTISPAWYQAKAELPPWESSGITLAMNNPMIQKAKSIYDWVDENPYVPDIDLGDKKLGYDYNTQFLGGNLGLGGSYDIDDDRYNVNLKWGTVW
jgi:hypothetical protein